MEAELSDTDKIIHKMFSSRWSGHLRHAPIEEMRKQLHKNLANQLQGYWSGSTAYSIMVDGGFICDGKRGTDKKLTALGRMFMESMEGGK